MVFAAYFVWAPRTRLSIQCRIVGGDGFLLLCILICAPKTIIISTFTLLHTRVAHRLRQNLVFFYCVFSIFSLGLFVTAINVLFTLSVGNTASWYLYIWCRLESFEDFDQYHRQQLCNFHILHLTHNRVICVKYVSMSGWHGNFHFPPSYFAPAIRHDYHRLITKRNQYHFFLVAICMYAYGM